jgi:hypothetical protein
MSNVVGPLNNLNVLRGVWSCMEYELMGAVAYDYSLGNFSCFLSRNFSHSVNPEQSRVLKTINCRLSFSRLRHKRKTTICRVMMMVVYMSNQELNIRFYLNIRS